MPHSHPTNGSEGSGGGGPIVSPGATDGYGDATGGDSGRRIDSPAGPTAGGPPGSPYGPATPSSGYYGQFMPCEMIFRKQDCLKRYPQCSWIFDERFVCVEAK